MKNVSPMTGVDKPSLSFKFGIKRANVILAISLTINQFDRFVNDVTMDEDCFNVCRFNREGFHF